MREHSGFLKTSSAVVKIAAWIFLFLGGKTEQTILLTSNTIIRGGN
jgi:hypothetical protein